MELLRYILVGYAFILVVLYTIFGLDGNLTPFSYIFVLMANTYMVICSRRFFMLFIIAFILLFCNYSIIYAHFAGTIQNFYTTPISEDSYVISFNILVLMNLLLLLFVRWERSPLEYLTNVFIDPLRKNKGILIFLFILLITIFFVGYKAPEVEGQRGEGSPIYEYSAILFIIYFYYCGDLKMYKRLGLLLVALFSFQSFIFGGRVDAIGFLLVAYIMLFMHKVSMRKVIIGMVAMFVFLSVIGVVRGELLSGNADVGSILKTLAENGFALDTAYSAYYTSESFVYIINKFEPQEILYLFIEFLKSIFIGSNPDLLLTSLSENYVLHYGGGILPFYFYFYLGAIGVFLSGLLVALYLNIVVKLKEDTSGYLKCLSVWVVCTTFRWYLYTPIPLLRGVIFLTIVYYSFSYIHCQLKRMTTRKIQASSVNKELLVS